MSIIVYIKVRKDKAHKGIYRMEASSSDDTAGLNTQDMNTQDMNTSINSTEGMIMLKENLEREKKLK